MTAFTIFLLCSVIIFLLIRQAGMAALLRGLAISAESRRPFLAERRKLLASRSLRRLQNSMNGLIAEIIQERERDRDYVQQVEATLGSIRDAVLILDENNGIRMANEALRQVFSENEALTGRRIETLVQSAGFLGYIKAVRTGARPAEIVEVIHRGSTFWFEVNGVLLPEQGGGEHLLLLVLHDITRLKHLERLRSEFVANVSHELRTPVTIIKGFTETLIEEGADLTASERERFLQKIKKNVTRLHLLLEDLLTLSRMESKTDPLIREPQSLNQLLAEAADNFRKRLAPEQRLELDLAAGLPEVPLDGMRVTQVIDNLMDNALRHAKGMTVLKLCSCVCDSTIRCYVEDNGCGIPQRDLPHIFERFYRVDKGRSRQLGGTGLGLSIAKHIILQHGGSVFAESKLGSGSRIGFELPLNASTRTASTTQDLGLRVF